jgi:putative endopeptidase
MNIFNMRTMLVCSVLLLSACHYNKDKVVDKSVDRTGTAKSSSGLNYDAMDLSIRPQDDFYAFVNGTWLNETKIPQDKSQYGSFDIIYEKTQKRLSKLIQEAAKSDDIGVQSNSQKLGGLYNSFINKDVIERLKNKPLHEELLGISQIKKVDELAEKFGQLSSLGVETPISYWVYPDAKNSTHYALWLSQSGLTLPNRDYYLHSTDEFIHYQETLKSYIADLFLLLDYKQAKVRAEKIYALEAALAKQHVDSIQSNDPNLTYNKLSVEKMSTLMGKFDWRKFAIGANITTEQMIVENLSFYKGFSTIYAQTSLATWKDYLTFKLVDRYAKYMHKDLVEKHFDFHAKTLNGVQQNKPRWKRAVSTTSNVLGDLLGEEYIKKYFSAAAKKQASVLVNHLFASYEEIINSSKWMSSETRLAALTKLSKITAKIGYPKKWRDYSALKINKEELVGNIMRFYRYDNQFLMSKVGTAVDKDYWMFGTPQTVDAYYSAVENEIVFPAAIFQPPFFDVNVDDAVNYGSIGWFIGHEMGHGFDNQGAKYDGDGNLSNWWNNEDLVNFNHLGDRLAKQYSAFEVLPNLYINGQLTKSENIADLTGVSIAFKAYKKSLNGKKSLIIDGYTPEQRFFMGFAQTWRAKLKEDSVRLMVTSDQHTPPKYRVNGPLKNVHQFYQAFDVKPGDKMYIPAKERAVFW